MRFSPYLLNVLVTVVHFYFLFLDIFNFKINKILLFIRSFSFLVSLWLFSFLCIHLCSNPRLSKHFWFGISLLCFFMNFSWNLGWNILILSKAYLSFTCDLINICDLFPFLYYVVEVPEERGVFFVWCSCKGSLGIMGAYFMGIIGIPLWMLLWWSFFSLLYVLNEELFCGVLFWWYFWRPLYF